MQATQQFNIYECYDQSGENPEYICDGHIDSVAFREKCFQEFYVKPMIVRHQWRKTRRFKSLKPGEKKGRSYVGTVHCTTAERGAVPITVGLA